MSNMSSSDSYYIGIDLSTQALKVIVIDHYLHLVSEVCIRYSEDLPHFGTSEGFLKENDTVTTPVKMWIEALDLALERLSSLVDLKRVAGIGGCAQQHGTVYTKQGFLSSLKSLDSSVPLSFQLGTQFTIPNSPIWMDNSTNEYCKHMEESFGGPTPLSHHTGSRAHTRFSAHQIYKVLNETPNKYHSTERILLISNFVGTLFAGNYMAIDLSDGSGMNLLDIFNKKWIPELCTLYDDVDISEKIGNPVPTVQDPKENSVLISPYFVKRYDFSPECKIGSFTGDNPATLVGMFLNSNDMVLSLGTSDVLISVAEHVKPSPDIHVFCNPLNSDNHMFIICYKNGSLVREKLKDDYCSGSWDKYNEILVDMPINPELVGNYFLQPEICPAGLTGAISSSYKCSLLSMMPAAIVRTVTEGQFLSKLCDIECAGFISSHSSRLIVVGGGSVNTAILSIVSDIFGMDVYRTEYTNIAARGGAYLAFSSVNGIQALKDVIIDNAPKLNLVCHPDEENHKMYIEMKHKYAVVQEEALAKISE